MLFVLPLATGIQTIHSKAMNVSICGKVNKTKPHRNLIHYYVV